MPSPTTLLREVRANPEPARLLTLLQTLSQVELRPTQIFQYHENLLFYKAYPPSVAVREFCDGELARFQERILALDENESEELSNSSIVGTTLRYPYDDAMMRWLHARLGKGIEIDWETYEERDDDPLGELVPFFIERAENDAADDGEITTRELIDAARGDRTALEWIMDGFERGFTDSKVREHLYDRMQLPLIMRLESPAPSRTLLEDGKPDKLFIWNKDAARAKFDLIAEIKRPLPLPKPVSPKRGRDLLDLVYGVLLPRLRELYPATHANPEEVYEFPLDRGVRIVLFFMKLAFRLPLEAGWGCLCLKNNVPIGYGAGGMLGDRSEIAINVFDTFRGGEAAWLYAQYARIFYALGKAPWLVTRKYQIGYENEEGLASGAYWFYDKLGFRSVDADIRKLADIERKKIAKQKGYRSPRRILKKLCEADIALSVNGESMEQYREFPLGHAGMLAAQMIAQQFDGQREHLEARILSELKTRFLWPIEKLTKPEKSSVAQFGLFALAINNLNKWPQKDQAAFFEFARLKGSAREADYARAFAENLRFFAELANSKDSGRVAKI